MKTICSCFLSGILSLTSTLPWQEQNTGTHAKNGQQSAPQSGPPSQDSKQPIAFGLDETNWRTHVLGGIKASESRQYDKAKDEFEAAIAGWDKTWSDDTHTAYVFEQMAVILCHQARYVEVDSMLQRSHEMYFRLFQSLGPTVVLQETAGILLSLGFQTEADNLVKLSQRQEANLLLLPSLKEELQCVGKAADAGGRFSQFFMGSLLEDGFGSVKQDLGLAFQWYWKAASQGYAPAQEELGRLYDDGRGTKQDYAEALKWYLESAGQGYAPAQNRVGRMYDFGRGVKQDYAEAFNWYLKAAEKGLPGAEANVAYLYETGEGVRQDYVEAIRWYQKAAKVGNAVAQNNLGWIYKEGLGAPPDYGQALELFEQAADKGNGDAESGLGYMYAHGEGVEQDFVEARKWYLKAAEQHVAVAQNDLGYMYLHGQGGPQDLRKAFDWYKAAADQGFARAKYNLGTMYALGQGVARDDRAAVHWLLAAAEGGDTTACNWLGGMFEDGRGVPKDDVQAYYWDLLAADSWTDARSRMERLQKQLTLQQVSDAQRRAREWRTQHPLAF